MVLRRAALTLSPADVPDADGYSLDATPTNVGCMSGALKQNLGDYPTGTQKATSWPDC